MKDKHNLFKNMKRANILLLFLACTLIFSSAVFSSYALFTSNVSGENSLSITVSSPGTIRVRIYKDDTKSDVSSLSKHENKLYFNVSDGYIMDSFSCTTGEASYDKVTNILTITNAIEDGTCEINYIEGYRKLHDVILSEPLKANNGLSVTSYATIDPNNNDNQKTLTSYYYRGNVTNNYIALKEGTSQIETLYRIVRINENSSIRIIREQGIDNNASYAINTNLNDFNSMYFSTNTTTGDNIGIVTRLNNWYQTNLSSITQIVDSDFCEANKVMYPGDEWSSGNAQVIRYPEYSASLYCPTDGNGYGIYKAKVGMLTVDEGLLGGIRFYNDNVNSYLVNGSAWWTMSPNGYMVDSAVMWVISKSGSFFSNTISSSNPIRPVVSLSQDTIISGIGTKDNPYKIMG